MTEFATLTFIALLAIISPGPDFAIVTKTSLGLGRKAGIATAFGIALANLLHVVLNLFGIGIILANSIFLFNIMKISGAVYLLYLGFMGLFAKPERIQDTIAVEPVPLAVLRFGFQGFNQGFFTSLLNPKAFLFYLSFFSVIFPKDITPYTQMLYGFWIAMMAFTWFSLVALFFTHAIFGKQIRRLKHWIERISGAALVFIGIRLLNIF